MMTHQARTLTTTALVGVALLLAGCSASQNSTTESPTPSAEETQTVSQPDRTVEVVEVISATEVIVTPSEEDDPLYGEEFTVEVIGAVAPTLGECGYDEAVQVFEDAYGYVEDNGDAGRQRIEGRYVSLHLEYFDEIENVEDGVHRADVRGIHGAGTIYAVQLLEEGFAVPATGDELDALGEHGALAVQTAQEEGAGLYGTCPGFGA